MEEEKAGYEDRLRKFLKEFYTREKEYKYKAEIKEMVNEGRNWMYVDWNDLYIYDRQLATALQNKPDEMLSYLNAAIYSSVLDFSPDYAEEKKEFFARIINLPESVPIRSIKSDYINKLIMIDGILVRVTPIKEKMFKAKFRHNIEECNQTFYWPPAGEEIKDVIEPPQVCPICGKPGNLRLIYEESQFIDYQRTVVQERPEEIPPGQIPRSIEVVLTRDLVDQARPGDRVSIVGILRVVPSQSKMKPIYDIVLDANSVLVSQKTLEEVEITREDEERILQLSKDPWIRKKIVASIAPAIYGHWDVKEAIALALFGGVQKETKDKTRIRGDIHILLVGDPGTAKSQLLQFLSRIAPRAVYTTGKGSSAAGLTAAVIRDKKSGDFYLEAGAMVLADGGVALVDEIDKMREEDRVAIHEAMEQQTVSIAKAGIVAKLNARATVIAAGNPKYGRYVEERSVADNINLPVTILSRFDLIFILKDKPSAEYDTMLASHMIHVHKEAENVTPEIPVDLLKKYISYAKRYYRPVLTEEAGNLLRDFFVEMRRIGSESQSNVVSITPRQLEALIRLAEAHAKMALKTEVTEEDALEAIRLMKVFMQQAGLMTESGVVDIDALMVGKSKSKREKMMLIEDTIRDILNETGEKCARIKDIMERLKGENISQKELEDLISKMYKDGIIVQDRFGCYSLA
nr:minichromosome maintenance protein MCM [Fervidicoccus fontis]